MKTLCLTLCSLLLLCGLAGAQTPAPAGAGSVTINVYMAPPCLVPPPAPSPELAALRAQLAELEKRLALPSAPPLPLPLPPAPPLSTPRRGTPPGTDATPGPASPAPGRKIEPPGTEAFDTPPTATPRTGPAPTPVAGPRFSPPSACCPGCPGAAGGCPGGPP